MTSGTHRIGAAGHGQPRPWATAFLLGLPITVALILASPDFQFPFLFDDFELLARAQLHTWARFLPDQGTLFYRPVAREGYFGLLLALGGGQSAAPGHILNFILLAAALVLLYAVVSRLADTRTGLIAALLFASFGQAPLLVAWASGCQDLLAIDFLLLALLCELYDRHRAALGAAVLALLSKETAAALFPTLALTGWITGRSSRPSKAWVAAYLGVLVAWAAIHPGIRLLAAGNFQRTGAGYLGLENPERWGFLLRGAATLLNLPPPGIAFAWPLRLTLPAILSFAVMLAGWGVASRGWVGTPNGRAWLPRVASLGVALALPPLLFTSVVVRHWAPYYVAVSAIGGCILLAAFLRVLPNAVVPAALCGFLALGVLERGLFIDPDIPTEANLYPASVALETVEGEFRKLAPRLPDSTRAMVLVFARGQASVRVHFYRYQILRWWYRNPTLEVVRPEMRGEVPRPERLFWIGHDLTVYEVDLKTLLPRPRSDYLDYQKVMRAYARGLADSGELEKAVWILTNMPEIRAAYRNLDHRIAAMLLLNYGYPEEAMGVLAGFDTPPRKDALDLVPVFLEVPATRPMGLEAAMLAFGLSPDDPDAVRGILGTFREHHAYPQMRVAAQRLILLVPGDSEAKAAFEEAARGQPADLLIAPAP